MFEIIQDFLILIVTGCFILVFRLGLSNPFHVEGLGKTMNQAVYYAWTAVLVGTFLIVLRDLILRV